MPASYWPVGWRHSLGSLREFFQQFEAICSCVEYKEFQSESSVIPIWKYRAEFRKALGKIFKLSQKHFNFSFQKYRAPLEDILENSFTRLLWSSINSILEERKKNHERFGFFMFCILSSSWQKWNNISSPFSFTCWLPETSNVCQGLRQPQTSRNGQAYLSSEVVGLLPARVGAQLGCTEVDEHFC